ncbi:MJ0042-type zinc finger domain-containing protein [Thiothrix subterranea]|uniref:MJ0042-type zinc finger domain-containing protein n=1 Tax=Thiothrix subterranea TaxID=2735563 RepID=UPI00280A8C9B|nr:MJ0042-type zinc finger domain-containing protein [Thiothrix subterranea]
MYTQCNHCNAIFRVTMKELTAAQGLLRCGECDNIFDAMKSLSQTLPEERRFAKLGTAAAADFADIPPRSSPTKLFRAHDVNGYGLMESQDFGCKQSSAYWPYCCSCKCFTAAVTG